MLSQPPAGGQQAGEARRGCFAIRLACSSVSDLTPRAPSPPAGTGRHLPSLQTSLSLEVVNMRWFLAAVGLAVLGALAVAATLDIRPKKRVIKTDEADEEAKGEAQDEKE